MNDDINSLLDKIHFWFMVNKLTVNVSKTKFMIFYKRMDRHCTTAKVITINNVNIKPVSHFTYLGMILDTTLQYKFHTNMNYDCQKIIQSNSYFTQVKIKFSQRYFAYNI